MNHTTTIAIIRIIIAAALAVSMVVAGASLSSVLLKQQKGYAAPQTKKQEQNTIQGLRGNLAKKSTSASQHLDQENQCLRAGKCDNAALGEQTLGNDNSVTGFTDQSKNVQAAVTPTPTPTLTSILPSTTLEVIKHCTPSCPGSTFSIQVTGPNNPQPSSFSLKDGGVQFVRFDGGTGFIIAESPVAGFNPPLFTFPPGTGNCQASPGSFKAGGTVNPGVNAICIITNVRR